jgi:molybdenum cofactor guanylyltransferase
LREEKTETATCTAGSDVAAFVLAGGKSTRMGHDKASLSFAGKPLAAHAISILRGAGLEACFAGANSALTSIAPVVEDVDSGLGPLSGICAALASTAVRWAVFIPVDLPFMPAQLITLMVRHAQVTLEPVTLPSLGGFAQTFPVVLDRSLLPALATELAAGRRGCFSALKAAAASLGQQISVHPIELLVQAGQLAHPQAMPPFRWFLNLNSPADLTRAQAFAEWRIA